jgi:hypothetical protein
VAIVPTTPTPNVSTRVTSGPAFPPAAVFVDWAPLTACWTMSLTGPASETIVRVTIAMTPNVAPSVAAIAARP